MKSSKESIFQRKTFTDLGFDSALSSLLLQKTNRFLYLGASQDEVMKAISGMPRENVASYLQRIENDLLSKNPKINIQRINSSPEAKQTKESFDELLTAVKDSKSLGVSSQKQHPDFPNGFTGTMTINRELDFLLWQNQHGLIDGSTLNRKLEEYMLAGVNALEGYLQNRSESFNSLLEQTKKNTSIVASSPYPENYLGDIQKDLSTTAKIDAQPREVIDVSVLRDPTQRTQALPDIIAQVKVSEGQFVALAKTNDSLQYHIDKGILTTYNEPEMKSRNRGVTKTKWVASKIDEAQQTHPELFGTDKLVGDKEGGARTRTMSAEEIAEIRQKSQAQFKSDGRKPITREDILGARLKLQESQINQIITQSKHLLVEYRDSQKEKILSELKSIFLGPSFPKLQPTDSQINQQITDMLQRVEANLHYKVNNEVNTQSGKAPPVIPRDSLANVNFERLVKATIENPRYAADVFERKFAGDFKTANDFYQKLQAVIREEPSDWKKEKMQEFSNNHLVETLANMLVDELIKLHKSNDSTGCRVLLSKFDGAVLQAVKEQGEKLPLNVPFGNQTTTPGRGLQGWTSRFKKTTLIEEIDTAIQISPSQSNAYTSAKFGGRG